MKEIKDPPLPQGHLDFYEAVIETHEKVKAMHEPFERVKKALAYIDSELKGDFEWGDTGEQHMDEIRDILDPKPESTGPGMTFCAGGDKMK